MESTYPEGDRAEGFESLERALQEEWIPWDEGNSQPEDSDVEDDDE